MKEYGRIGQKRWEGQFYEEFLPELSGMRGIKVFQEMKENDDTVGAILFAIKMMIRQVEWHVEPGGDSAKDKEAAEFVESCMGDMQATWTDMVHIYSQKHSEAMYDELVSSFCDSYDPIPKSEIYKVLGKLKNFEIFNSGMLSKQSQSGESYRIMAGSDVSDAIDKDSGRMYSAGHAFCKAVDNAEGDVTIGYSSASKVWSSAYKDLKDYIQWCDGLGKKIANKDIKVKTNTNFDFLPQPKALVEYPEDIFYADFTAETYSCDPVIKYRRKESDYECCRLTDAMVVVKNCEKTKVSVEVSVGEISENLECDIKARYRSLGNRFIVCSGKEEIPMDKFLTEQPLIYKTVKDMTITGIDVIEGDFESELFDSNIIEGVDWKGIEGLYDRRGKNKAISQLSDIEKLKAENRLLKAQTQQQQMEIDFLKNSTK